MLFNTIVCGVYIAASSLLAMQVYMQVSTPLILVFVQQFCHFKYLFVSLTVYNVLYLLLAVALLLSGHSWLLNLPRPDCSLCESTLLKLMSWINIHQEYARIEESYNDDGENWNECLELTLIRNILGVRIRCRYPAWYWRTHGPQVIFMHFHIFMISFNTYIIVLENVMPNFKYHHLFI